ncbi:hypothetical protein [Oceanicoccus sagamiensis]|uniref:Uncharacterized protein n=1 Tax=Oceanicoccus sagamiensis TaxID=716816 RepID=A0A1X9NBH0_9GAMM|nr:hypothetical protein [Oceanicoccus sagamiensis]ARN75380.1 hypothetical protein BST96_15425 [Oceanicoccus sagamiensis]
MEPMGRRLFITVYRLLSTLVLRANSVPKLSIGFVITLALAAISTSATAVAEGLYLAPDQATSTAFYQQFRQTSSNRANNGSKSLLEQVMPKRVLLEPLVDTHDQEDDLAFNYLWLQQHQQGYSRREGGAAAGKLLRMGIKSLYKSYSGSGTINTNNHDDSDFKSKAADVDYRLRLSSDKVKLKVEYEF